MSSTLPFTNLAEAITGASGLFHNHGIGVYDRRGQNVERRTYTQIAEMAQDRARRLAACGVGVGDRVMIALPTSWELLEIYFGTLMRGAHPVLVAPGGGLGAAATQALRLATQADVVQPKRIFCDETLRQHFRNDSDDPLIKKISDQTALLTHGELAKLAPESIAFPTPNAADLAFLQLTSGSTGRQRAVQISHASAVHNTRAIGVLLEARPGNTVVSWLPLNHDMGLIGCLLFSLVYGLELWLLRPETFLARPSTWLRTISTHRGRFSPAPNFAYQLCADRIEADEIAGVDLSCWSSAMTGAEMIRSETCTAFVDKFNPYGFGRRQWRPSYGMAEATLAATFDRQCAGIRTATTDIAGSLRKEAVCCGPAILHTSVQISSCATPGEFLNDGAIGEVWIKGPGVFGGYFNDPAATAETIHNGWLRTGDLGFLKDGELYITGRIKDLIIINGHNWMPHELEREADRATGSGGAERSCAFSVEVGSEGEQPVLVVEIAPTTSEKLAELEHAVRSGIGRALGLPLADVVFVKRGQIPKTTSGKVQRAELRKRFIEGRLERLK